MLFIFHTIIIYISAVITKNEYLISNHGHKLGDETTIVFARGPSRGPTPSCVPRVFWISKVLLLMYSMVLLSMYSTVLLLMYSTVLMFMCLRLILLTFNFQAPNLNLEGL